MPDETSELIDALRLNLVPGIGPRLQQALLEAFGSPAGILAASVQELQQVDGIGPKLSDAIVARRDLKNYLIRALDFMWPSPSSN